MFKLGPGGDIGIQGEGLQGHLDHRAVQRGGVMPGEVHGPRSGRVYCP